MRKLGVIVSICLLFSCLQTVAKGWDSTKISRITILPNFFPYMDGEYVGEIEYGFHKFKKSIVIKGGYINTQNSFLGAFDFPLCVLCTTPPNFAFYEGGFLTGLGIKIYDNVKNNYKSYFEIVGKFKYKWFTYELMNYNSYFNLRETVRKSAETYITMVQVLRGWYFPVGGTFFINIYGGIGGKYVDRYTLLYDPIRWSHWTFGYPSLHLGVRFGLGF